ncbi:MAG: TolC family protein [Muribaculaceae bacterium]|nr:TolC family protein [Muribaculaceae bacterium]
MTLRYIIAGCMCMASCLATFAQQPLSLSAQECRSMALAASEDMKQSELGLQKADLDTKIARAAFLPKIDGSATGAYVVPDIDMMGMEMRIRGMYMAGITLTQPIYTGGRLTTGKKLAKIGRETAAIQQRMTRMDIIAEADKAYWTYIAVSSKVRMLESYIVQMDTLYAQTRLAVDCGMVTDNDLLRISSRRSDIQYQWQKANNGMDLCRLALCRLLGVDNSTEIVPTDTVIRVERPSFMAYNRELRPEIQLLNKQDRGRSSSGDHGSGRDAAHHWPVGRIYVLWQSEDERNDRYGQWQLSAVHTEFP